MNQTAAAGAGTPRTTKMQVIAVAGRENMLLDLGGAHGPCFTRSPVILEQSAAQVGLGARENAVTLPFLVPNWKFDNRRPCLVR